MGVGIDPEDTLIIRGDHWIQKKNGEMVDGDIFFNKKGKINGKKMNKKYGKGWDIIKDYSTEILMGGTGDQNTLNDNDILAEFIDVSPSDLFGNPRTSITGDTYDSNFIF